MKDTCPFYITFQVLNIHLIKIPKIKPPDLLFLDAFIRFYISRYTIFHKFLELHSIISVKKIFVKTDLLKPLPPT